MNILHLPTPNVHMPHCDLDVLSASVHDVLTAGVLDVFPARFLDVLPARVFDVLTARAPFHQPRAT